MIAPTGPVTGREPGRPGAAGGSQEPGLVRQGGRACGRVLSRLAALALMLAGLGLTLGAAWVPAKAALAQILLERAFDAALATHRPVRPWPWADTAPVARLTVPRLDARAIILSGGSGQAMAFGPTEMPLPAARMGADITLLAAHRDTHFAFLRALRPGDRIALQRTDGRTRHYRVVALQTVRWDRFALPGGTGRALLALSTCYPFDALTPGPLRRVVWAEAEE